MGSIWLAILCSAFLVALSVPRTVNAASKSGKVNKAASEKKTVPSNKTPAKKERVIDSPYFISKWDKAQWSKETSHGLDYSTGCHPHYHPECPIECQVVDIWWYDEDAGWFCEEFHRVWSGWPCHDNPCTGAFRHWQYEVHNVGWGTEPSTSSDHEVGGIWVDCDEVWDWPFKCCEAFHGWFVSPRTITTTMGSVCPEG